MHSSIYGVLVMVMARNEVLVGVGGKTGYWWMLRAQNEGLGVRNGVKNASRGLKTVLGFEMGSGVRQSISWGSKRGPGGSIKSKSI